MNGADGRWWVQAVCADESWADVQRVMGAAGRPAVHMSGAATNPFGPTFVYGYRNVVFEVMKSGNLASVILFKVRAAPALHISQGCMPPSRFCSHRPLTLSRVGGASALPRRPWDRAQV